MPIDKQSQVLLQAAVERSSWDPAYFLRFFLSHWFPSDLPPFHLGILALMQRKVEFLNHYPAAHSFLLEHFRYAADPDDPDSVELPVFQKNPEGKIIMVAGEHNNIIVPRGFSKTTLMNGSNLYDVLTDGKTFCVYISKSSDHAETQLGNIKIELETNGLLRNAYGNVVPTRADVEKWQSDQLQLTNGAILVARGRGGQVRGLNFQARRPNRIVLDDVEDDDKVASTTERTKNESWFYSSVEKAGQVMEGMIGHKDAQDPLRITNLGTLLGAECLMMTLAKDPKFNTVRFGAKLKLDEPDDEQMLWPFKMGYETYQRERARHQKVGKLAEFTRELDSSIRVTDESVFPSTFIYQPTPLSDLVQRALALDPAISKSKRADSAALVVAGRRASDGALWFLDEWGGKGKEPKELIDAVFEYRRKWQTILQGIEAIAYQEALLYIMREEMARRQDYFVVEAIRHGQAEKLARIEGILSPRYKVGVVRHLRPLSNLEGNLADWPNGKKDFADAASMALKLLGESQDLALGQFVGPSTLATVQDYAPLPELQTLGGYIMEGRGRVNIGQRYPV
jgi:hypothetical protein